MSRKALFVVGFMSLAFLAPAMPVSAGDNSPQAVNNAPPPELLYSVSYVQSNLKKGKTTRADVLQSFGQPSHQKVRASDSGASETFYYQRGAAQQQQQKKGGFGKGLRGLANIAGGVSNMLGYNKAGYQAAAVSNQADRIAGGAEMMGAAGATAEQPATTNGPSMLTIEMTDGVVQSYSLE